MSTVAILTAAGSGVRLGHELPKALVPVAGAPMLVHAARNLARSGVVDEIIVTAPEGYLDRFQHALASDDDITVPVTVLLGGAHRQQSVYAAICALPDDADVVLVHDAARPFASPDLVRRVVTTVKVGNPAVVPALAVTDTIKAVAPARTGIGEPYRQPRRANAPSTQAPPVLPGQPVPATEKVGYTIAREALRRVQTPQGFDRAVLQRVSADAHEHPGIPFTDDAGLVEELSHVPVMMVPGEEDAAKITTERDLRIAQALHG